MQEDLGDKGMEKEWTQPLIIPLPKKGNVKQCPNYCNTCLISPPSKSMLQSILHKLKTKAEELLARRTIRF